MQRFLKHEIKRSQILVMIFIPNVICSDVEAHSMAIYCNTKFVFQNRMFITIKNKKDKRNQF